MSRFTSLPLQASPASLPPASAPALLLPCATALVRALVRASSARRRDHCPAAAVGRPRVRVCPLRPAAGWPRPPVDAAPPLAAACCPSPRRGAALWLKPPLLCFARRGPLLCSPLKPPLLCFARRGPPLCSPPLLAALCSARRPRRGLDLHSARRPCSALCSALPSFGAEELLCSVFLLEQRRAPSPPLVLFAL